LALIIAFSIPILSGYFLYCDLADDDLFSSDAQYENDDLDDLFMVPDCQNQLKFFGSIGSNALFPVFLPEANAIEQVSFFCSLRLASNKNPLSSVVRKPRLVFVVNSHSIS
jgi:hypothetical protein